MSPFFKGPMTTQQLPSLASQASPFGVLHSRIREEGRRREGRGLGEVSAVIRRRRRDVGQINTADVHSQSLDSKRIGTQGNGAAEKEEKDRTTSVG